MKEFEIAKLDLKDGDILVLRLLRPWDEERDHFAYEFLLGLAEGKNIRTGIMDNSAELIIVHPKENP